MSEVILAGEYLPAGTEVDEGREAWGRIKEGVRMLREDWLVVGNALAIGRAENPSNQAFGAWCDENGFGEIAAAHRSDAIWFADNQEAVLIQYQDDSGVMHPQAIRRAYRKHQKQLEGSVETQAPKTPKQPKRRVGRIVDAVRDLSDCAITVEILLKKATDKQRASLRQEIKHARAFINQLHEELSHESD